MDSFEKSSNFIEYLRGVDEILIKSENGQGKQGKPDLATTNSGVECRHVPCSAAPDSGRIQSVDSGPTARNPLIYICNVVIFEELCECRR